MKSNSATASAPSLPCDATQIGRFRRAVGEQSLEQLFKATIETAVQIKAVKRQRTILGVVMREGQPSPHALAWFDGHTLAAQLEQTNNLMQDLPRCSASGSNAARPSSR